MAIMNEIMVQTIRSAGTVLRAALRYLADERKENRKIQEIGIRKYIEESIEQKPLFYGTEDHS